MGLLVVAAGLALPAGPGAAQLSDPMQSVGVRPDLLKDVGIDQKLNQQVPLDLTFRDETGKTVQLSQYFGQKPVLLSLVYFNCPMLCTQVLKGVGFRYAYDPDSKQFAHASAIMVLTPDGKLSKYFYGIQYSPRDLRLGLVEASARKIGTPVDSLLLVCYHSAQHTRQNGL